MRDPILRAYWEDQFPESTWDPKGSRWRKPREQVELVGSSLNKIGRFIANPIIRHIVGQEASSFKFRQIMDEGKILLVNLSKGDLGPDNASLLGAVLDQEVARLLELVRLVVTKKVALRSAAALSPVCG